MKKNSRFYLLPYKGYCKKRLIQSNAFLLLFIGLFITLLQACAPMRQIPKNQSLLRKNKVNISDSRVAYEDISGFISQKPNRKILFLFKFHLGSYALGSHIKNDNWLKKLLTQTIGEEPVILDTLQTAKSCRQIEMYLNSKGYFHSQVSWKSKTRHRRTTITYAIQVAKPYKIRNINLNITDKRLEKLIRNDSLNALIKPGMNYDADLFDAERTRITNLLKEDGYYFFTKDYIRFRVDSAFRNHVLDVELVLLNPVSRSKENPDSFITISHKRYWLNKVYVNPDFRNALNVTAFDTLRSENLADSSILYLVAGPLSYKPRMLNRMIFLRPGQHYKAKDVEQTQRRLSELKNFKYVNIRFALSTDSMNQRKGNLLDAYIELTRLPRMMYSIEAEGSNSGGNPGLAGSFIWQNRNLFRGAEIFDFKAKGAMEVQKVIGENDPLLEKGTLPFNTFEAGVQTSLETPVFLVPIKPERFSKYFKPKTRMTAGFNYQKRPDYTRYILNTSFGYEWRESKFKKHNITPVNINSVKIFPSDTFLRKISQYDQRIRNSYTDHMDVGMSYTFIYNDQVINKPVNFFFLRLGFESAGNLLYLTNTLMDKTPDQGSYYTLFNVRYAQFVRLNADARYYTYFNKENLVAWRGYFGIGIPYGNMDVLPFEKSFFVGGANGIRAWPIRTLGPGGFNPGNRPDFDRTGDISFEGSAEYRFPLYKILKGALFLDAGNVWLKRKNNDYQNGEFHFNQFYKEIALGTGIGARFDFSIFIIRTDFAFRLRDPQFSGKNRWVIKNGIEKVNFNFGIGYPF